MKPITRRSVKLYEGLTPKQLAALTLHSMANLDGCEIDKIRAAVPWKRYDCIDAEYTDWRDALQSVVMLWSCEYWRQRFIHAASLCRLQVDGGADTTVRQIRQGVARQFAHSKVLHELCNAHGLDYDAALELAGVPDRYDPLNDGELDEAYYRQWFSDLSECLPAA